MGGFKGHVIPGTAFVLFSVWWFVAEILQRGRRKGRNIEQRTNSKQRRDGTKMKAHSPLWYSCHCERLSRIPMEPLIKVILALGGIMVELPFAKSATLFDKNSGEFLSANLPNYQHAMMYCFFGLTGIVELVIWYDILPLPPKIDYLAMAFAFWMEGFLFSVHLHGRDELNARLHSILYVIIFITAAIFTLATFCDQVLPFLSFVKIYLLSLQGTWFFQIAFVLYGPKPWKNIHSNVEFVAIAFALHALSLFLIQLIAHIICRDLWIKKNHQIKGTLTDESCDED